MPHAYRTRDESLKLADRLSRTIPDRPLYIGLDLTMAPWPRAYFVTTTDPDQWPETDLLLHRYINGTYYE